MISRTKTVLASVVLALVLTACGAPRWQVNTVENSYSDPSAPEDNFASHDAILIDTRSGKTWILSTNDDDNYYWQAMSRD